MKIFEGIFDPISKNLNPEIWDNNTIKPNIKSAIINHIQKWLVNNNLKNTLESINVLGSNSGYQYSKNSDLDVNLVLNIPDHKLKIALEHIPEPINLKFPINFYITNKYKKEWEWETNGIYDLLKNKWNKSPEIPTEQDNLKIVSEVSRIFVSGLDAVISEYRRDLDVYKTLKDTKTPDQNYLALKRLELNEDAESLKIAYHVIHSFRQEAFTDKPFKSNIVLDVKHMNNSINNLIYKYLERLGYFNTINNILENHKKII
jgi:hypothetical protein